MKQTYTVSLSKIMKELSLEALYLPKAADEILIESSDVSRPGLPMIDYYEFFDNRRIQIIGKVEASYLETLTEDEFNRIINKFCANSPAAIVVTRGLEISECIKPHAEAHKVPLLVSNMGTSEFMASLIAFLNLQLAPRITRHGVLVEVYGEGILLLGESGVGKSETAIELVKRGHRLIADDAVEIRKVSSKSLVGSAPDNIRHFIELRGIGIINISRIFGVGAVKLTEKIDLVINMEHWDANKVYDRMGLENEMTEILGLQIPSLTIPIKPGRNLAIIIEVAAMNNRQKKLGYNAAQDLLKKLGMQDDTNTNDDTIVDIF